MLCDIGLPDSDGYIVGSVLRQSGATASAKLIAVTGFGGPQNRLKALAAGFDEHLVKPVDPQDLLHKMQRRALTMTRKVPPEKASRRRRPAAVASFARAGATTAFLRSGAR